MTQKVAVIPGLFAGKYTTRPLRKALERAGYKVVPSAQADIILTHSAGCFELPAPRKGQVVVMVDPPYWPGRSSWNA